MNCLLGLALMFLTPDEPRVDATVETSLTTAKNQIRQLAFDDDQATFFLCEKTGPDDHFTLVLDKPVPLRSIAVKTGRPDGADKLDSGTIEVSDDGKTFQEVAKFTDGSVKAELLGRKVQAIRIHPSGEMTHPLAIAEFTIDSETPIAKFRYPVEFILDVTDAPELKAWTEKAAKECERWYPRLNDELKSQGFKPSQVIRLTMKTSYKGVAATGGSRITGSVQYFRDNPEDIGAMIHETIHVIQHYRGRNPSWLVEGVADYIRFFQYEPGKIGPISPKRSHYNGSYRTTAAFLDYLTTKYDKQIVSKLNTLMREGKYKEEIFKEITGKTVQELDEEWRAVLAEKASK